MQVMTTYGGERVSLDSGAPSLFTIGVSLGRIARWCGHTNQFYPVLSHCWVVANMLPIEEAIHGFLHDSQESLFADVPSPMKSQVARNREHKVLERIYASVELDFPNDDVQERVHEADQIVLIAEAHMLEHPGEWGSSYDEKAARLTRGQMKKSRVYLEAKNAGSMYCTWFRRYATLAGFVSAV